MIRIKIAICDDDITVYEQLEEIIGAYSIVHNEEIDTIYFMTTEELFASKSKYDILFLDLRFKSKNTGIDAARQMRLNGNECIIIILTILNSKALEGYDVGAYRYLVKPINKDKIFAVLNNAVNKIKNSSSIIFVKDQYGTEVIPLNTILFIQSNVRKRFIYTNNTTIETWESLKSIYEQLPKQQFYYAQKSYIINFAKITKVMKNSITLESGDTIAVSREYKKSFYSSYFDYIGK